MYRITYQNGKVKFVCEYHYACIDKTNVVSTTIVDDTGSMCLECDNHLNYILEQYE